MITNRPISSIWFGSEKFLKMNLDNLIKKGDVLFYTYIKHHPEEDEKKAHIHLYIEPDGKMDTKQLVNLITEYDLTDASLEPVKLLPVRNSKFGEWYLYSIHNISYLASKGQKRKYHYNKDDFVSSNDDFLTEKVHQIDLSKINTIELVRNAASNGITFESIVRDGQVPIQLINQYQKAYDMIFNLVQNQAKETYRNLRKSAEEENKVGIRFINGDPNFYDNIKEKEK